MKHFGFWPIVAFILLAVPLMVYAFGSNPPLPYTGAPGQGTCASCHGTLTAGSGVTVNAPASYVVGGSPVSMTVTIPATGGFELAVLTLSGNSQAGTLVAGSNDGVSTPVGSTIQYVYSTVETTSWTFGWTPPTTNVGNVVVYVTGGNHGTTYSNSYVISAPTPDFSLSASPTSLTVAQGASGTDTITVHPINAFNSSVTLSTPASGLPLGVMAAFSPTSATTTSTLTFTALASATTGTFPVTVTGTSGSLTRTTTITLTVSAGAPPPTPTLSATPSALSFAYQIANPAPPPPPTQNINVTTTGTVTYSVAPTGGTWLHVTPTSGTSSGPVTVSVIPTGLSAGTYNGTVTITATGATGSPQSVQVTLVVTPAGPSSGLTVNPTALNFNYPSGGGGDDAGEALLTQRLAITSTTGATVSYTDKEVTQSGGNWLMLGSSGGTTPGTLIVSVNPRGLASGIYHGTITITPSGATAGPQMVPVTLTVGSPTTSSLRVTPRHLTFSFSGTTDTGSKTVQVTSGTAREFSAAASGGSWLNVSPTSATTPATLTVSVDARGLSMGTYSGMITLTTGTRKTSVYVTVFVATSGSGGGGGDDGSETESQLAIQPVVTDPTNSGTVGAALLDAAGVPVSSQTASNSGNLALALSKTAHAPAGTSAGAQLVPAENLTKLTELGFDVRQGGHCTAKSPHFVVVTSDDVTHVLTGCANGTIQTAPARGWIRVRFDPANPAQASPPVSPGQQIKSIAIVLDEGPEATPNPGGGLVVLDNIDVNGVIVGKD
jgi:hypothetical protein